MDDEGRKRLEEVLSDYSARVSDLKGACNRHVYGRCSTLACLRRGGFERNLEERPPLGTYDMATCEPHALATLVEALPVLLAPYDRMEKALREIANTQHLGGQHSGEGYAFRQNRMIDIARAALPEATAQSEST